MAPIDSYLEHHIGRSQPEKDKHKWKQGTTQRLTEEDIVRLNIGFRLVLIVISLALSSIDGLSLALLG